MGKIESMQRGEGEQLSLGRGGTGGREGWVGEGGWGVDEEGEREKGAEWRML